MPTSLNDLCMSWAVCTCLTEISRIGLFNNSKSANQREERACGPRPFLVLHCDITPSFPSFLRERVVPGAVCFSEPEQSPFWFGLSESHPPNWNQPLYSFLAPNENLIIWTHFAQKYGFCLKFLKMKMWQNCIFSSLKMTILINPNLQSKISPVSVTRKNEC